MIPLDISVPETGKLTQLADDLYWARFDLPFRLNHINLYMLDTPDGWCLIDAGVNNEVTAAHWQMLLEGPLSGQPVAFILITHHHVDHMGYAGALESLTGAPCFSSAEEAVHGHWLFDLTPEEFGAILSRTYRWYGMPAETIQRVAQNGSRYRANASPLPIFQEMTAGEVIHSRAGAWEVRIDTGHSDAQISLMDRQRNLFLSVDFLLPRISPNISADIRNPDFDSLSHYFTYLEEMTSLPADMSIFPGHDWPFRDGGTRAASLIEHHQHRLQQLEEAAQTQPLSVASAMDVLFGRAFGDHELYFASGEARAHLTHLVATGRLHKTQHDKGHDLYAPV